MEFKFAFLTASLLGLALPACKPVAKSSGDVATSAQNARRQVTKSALYSKVQAVNRTVMRTLKARWGEEVAKRAFLEMKNHELSLLKEIRPSESLSASAQENLKAFIKRTVEKYDAQCKVAVCRTPLTPDELAKLFGPLGRSASSRSTETAYGDTGWSIRTAYGDTGWDIQQVTASYGDTGWDIRMETAYGDTGWDIQQVTAYGDSGWMLTPGGLNRAAQDQDVAYGDTGWAIRPDGVTM